MRRLAGGLLFLFALIFVAPAPAQWIFAKKTTRANPTQRVPELILIVKTDPDERKRAQAAEELRDYDTATFTEIVPVLADVLTNDKKQSVRSEALASLAKIRPVTTLAGQALEKAAAQDESLRVRWQAKTALPKYHLAGYTARKTEPAPIEKKQSSEPPLGPIAPVSKAPTPLSISPPVSSPFPRPLPPGVATPKESSAPPVEGPSLFPK